MNPCVFNTIKRRDPFKFTFSSSLGTILPFHHPGRFDRRRRMIHTPNQLWATTNSIAKCHSIQDWSLHNDRFLDPSPFLRLFLTVFHQSTALCHSALSSTCPVAGLQSSTYDQELKSSVARSIVSFFISKSPSASSLLLYLLLLLQFILQCLVFHHPITQRDHGGKAAVVVVETGDRCKQALAGDDSLPRGRRWRMWCKEEETPTDVMAVLCSWCLFAALLVAVALLMVIAYFHICWDQRSRRRRRSRAEASPTPSLVESWVSMVFLKNWFSVYFLPLPFSTSFSASSPPPSDRHLLIPR